MKNKGEKKFHKLRDLIAKYKIIIGIVELGARTKYTNTKKGRMIAIKAN